MLLGPLPGIFCVLSFCILPFLGSERVKKSLKAGAFYPEDGRAYNRVTICWPCWRRRSSVNCRGHHIGAVDLAGVVVGHWLIEQEGCRESRE